MASSSGGCRKEKKEKNGQNTAMPLEALSALTTHGFGSSMAASGPRGGEQAFEIAGSTSSHLARGGRGAAFTCTHTWPRTGWDAHTLERLSCESPE